MPTRPLAVLLLSLLGCARGGALTAPVELAPASRAWGIAATDFLAPTALGAADDTLCAWARGEAPPANVTRWVAEGRLRFRAVVAAGPYANVAKGNEGPLDTQLAALAAPEIALARTCGTPRPGGILVLADREVSYGAVADAVELARAHGYVDAWLAVEAPVTETRPAPGFQEGAPVVALVAPEGRVALSNRDGRGYEGAPGALAEPLAAVGAPGKVGCATISARPAVPWATALAAMEALRGEGVDLQVLDMEGAPGAAPETRATPPAREARTWAIDATIAAVPARTLSPCGDAPMGWWCDRTCAPALWPEEPTRLSGARPLGELVYTAHRIMLAAPGATEPLYDDGVLAADTTRTALVPPCPANATRWLVFDTGAEAGVGWPADEATLSAVRAAIGWRRAIEAGTPPWAEIRAAVAEEGPRARLAWEALVSPAWHEGRVDASLRSQEVGTPPATPAPLPPAACDAPGSVD